ncbi:transglutaminase domain-containing protein [Paenibacillus sp. GCM10027626]|uniref:transglutaminase domain-containing protein n=1 Tax=Paenibacillus sp. GCM10027626 TaxID=3273411 RepID=UPI003632056A
MRKFMLTLMAFVVLLAAVAGAAGNVQAAANAGQAAWLDKGELNKGLIAVHYNAEPKVKIKLMIAKGAGTYTYTVRNGVKEERFPLQMGNGDYTVTLLEQVNGNQYKVIGKDTVKLNLADQNVVYLNTVQNIEWDAQNQAIVKANELIKGKKTDAEKVKAIHDFIINNIAYDNTLAKTVTTDYLPQIDRTLKDGKDICYGYAALFAAMLRAVDIPAKMTMGKTTYVDVYHAWNEVLMDGKWVTIDTTIDAGLKNTKKALPMIKDDKNYKVEKQY